MLGVIRLGRTPTAGLLLISVLGLTPAAQAAVPCTVAGATGPVTRPAATLGQCVMQLQRARGAPDADGRIHGTYGPVRLAVSPRRAFRFYEDGNTWSVLEGHSGWAGHGAVRRLAPVAKVPVPRAAPPVRVAPARPLAETEKRRPTFAQALEAALAEPLPAPVTPALKPLPDTRQLLQRALVSHGFTAHPAKSGGCGVQLERQWYRLTTASLPDCALQLAAVGRKAPRLRLVTAEWNGQALWLGPDAVYQKGRNGWAVAAGY